jgi:hypothetical protein
MQLPRTWFRFANIVIVADIAGVKRGNRSCCSNSSSRCAGEAYHWLGMVMYRIDREWLNAETGDGPAAADILFREEPDEEEDEPDEDDGKEEDDDNGDGYSE